ncbi:MAG: hypothetical protein JNK87_23410, partial [Bryobacterales bacterium]|nr:hypothetical protein [Bryobacterales bacterium]
APFTLNSITVVDPNIKVPTTHQWSFSIQQEIAPRTVLEVNYIGRRAYHLYGAYNANQTNIYGNGFLDAFRQVQAGGQSPLINQLYGPDTRRAAAETGSDMLRRLFPADLRNNAVGTIAQDAARRQQGTNSLSQAAGLGPFFMLSYPQYAGAMNVIDSNDFSTYHALEIQVERRFSNGFAGQISYTLSKSLDTRSFDPAFTTVGTGSGQSASSTPFDLSNRKLNYAISDFDRTHVVQSYVSYELPFGKGKRFGAGSSGAVQRVIGGWNLAGFTTLMGGRPFTVYSGFNTVSNIVQSPANCNGCTRQDGGVFDGPGGFIWYFDQQTTGKFSTPAAGQLGNTGRNFFRGPGSVNFDLSLQKRTAITDRIGFELRADATNLTNTPTFGFPTAVVSSTIFGRIRDTVSSQSRKIQLGAKFIF